VAGQAVPTVGPRRQAANIRLWRLATSDTLTREQRMPENILILANWWFAALVDDTMPPRDPHGDDDEEEEDEDEETNDQPPVVREPESDE
jgi:hypothetical protein